MNCEDQAQSDFWRDQERKRQYFNYRDPDPMKPIEKKEMIEAIVSYCPYCGSKLLSVPEVEGHMCSGCNYIHYVYEG